MRIAEISTLSRPVPPEGEGSVEALVSLITEELVRRGHDVTLFAVPDSKTSARLESPAGVSYTKDTSKWDWQLYEAWQVQSAFSRWKEFDVIHCHSYHHGMMYCDWVPIPSLHSFHLEPGPDYPFLAHRTRNRHLHFCSRYQARHFSDVRGLSVIPHGMDAAQLAPPSGVENEGYLAFLGRFLPEKGVMEALKIAEISGRRLLLAGPENEFFRTSVKPRLNPRIEYVGEIRGRQKVEFLGRAHCLLYPIQRPEPFGLVLIESMLCGTPVVARNIGAVPEIVENGVTGWLAEEEAGFLEGIEAAAMIDRASIRQEALHRFSSGRMVDDMEELMERLVSEAAVEDSP